MCGLVLFSYFAGSSRKKNPYKLEQHVHIYIYMCLYIYIYLYVYRCRHACMCVRLTLNLVVGSDASLTPLVK